MIHLKRIHKIDKRMDCSSTLRWEALLGLVGIILCSGCQSIPSDLMKTFPKESTQYIYVIFPGFCRHLVKPRELPSLQWAVSKR